MGYKGVIIEESLGEISILEEIKILDTKVEQVTSNHKTPWLKQWTLHTVEVPEDKADELAEKISRSFDNAYPDWYADYKNDKYHFIIFKNKVFTIHRSNPEEYKAVVEHGLSLGIPDYQLDFSPYIKEWVR